MSQVPQLIVGVMASVFFFFKVILHMYLDNKNGQKIKPFVSFNINLYYFIPYTDDVSDRTKRVKDICNFFWIIFVLLVVLLFAILFIY
jgi:hypothetical protein